MITFANPTLILMSVALRTIQAASRLCKGNWVVVVVGNSGGKVGSVNAFMGAVGTGTVNELG